MANWNKYALSKLQPSHGAISPRGNLPMGMLRLKKLIKLAAFCYQDDCGVIGNYRDNANWRRLPQPRCSMRRYALRVAGNAQDDMDSYFARFCRRSFQLQQRI